MTPNLRIKIGGLKAVSTTLQLIDRSIVEDWTMLWRGFIRPTKAPGMVGLVIRREYTLEGSTEMAFDHSGRNAYFGEWPGYEGEERYARVKAKYGGGTSILVWQGAKNPLRKAFTLGHPDHQEFVRGKSMRWGAKGEKGGIAARLAEGGFYQPWDRITVNKQRKIVRLNEAVALQVIKGMQTILRGRLGREGFRAARRNIEDAP